MAEAAEQQHAGRYSTLTIMGTDTAMSTCSDCGTLVTDEGAHDTFHHHVDDTKRRDLLSQVYSERYGRGEVEGE